MAARSTPYGNGSSEEGRMIYVGSMNYKTTWEQLRDHMKQAGEVEFADVLMNDRGRSKGVGFVRYKTEAEAQAAISELNGSTLDDKSLVVDPWTGPKPPRQSKGWGGNSSAPQGMEAMMPLMAMMGMGMPGMSQGGGNKAGGSSKKTALVEQVKAYQRKGESEKLEWYTFVESQASGKKDPNYFDEDKLETFLRNAGETPQSGAVSSEKADLVAKVKAYQRQGKGYKLAWDNFIQDETSRGKKDPALQDEQVLAKFLSATESGDIAPMDDAPNDKALLIDRVKAYQKKGDAYKAAWYKFAASTGSDKKDPSCHEEAILEQFLAQTESGEIGPAQGSGGAKPWMHKSSKSSEPPNPMAAMMEMMSGKDSKKSGGDPMAAMMPMMGMMNMMGMMGMMAAAGKK